MKVWHDWEFLEDGTTIEPISVGMVAEDGRELYRVFRDAPWNRIREHKWLMDNVVPGLGRNDGNYMSRLNIKQDVADFLFDSLDEKNGHLELWGWYSAYDHVCLAQLFGRMIDLPKWCPMLTLDVKQEFIRLGNPEYPRQTQGLHNALEDAKFLKARHLWLQNDFIYQALIR